MPFNFITKVTSVGSGGLKFTKEILLGLLRAKEKEEYVPRAFSEFMTSLFLNPNFKVGIIRELERIFSVPARKVLEAKYKAETFVLGENISSVKRGSLYPILEKNWFYPSDIDFSNQQAFIKTYYPEHLVEEKTCYHEKGHYYPKMTVYMNKEHTSKFLIYYSGGAFLLNHHTIFAQFPNYFKDHNLVFVQYGLAPEYSYPQCILDALDAYYIICNNYSPSHISLIGDSAGGHLCLQVAIYIKNHSSVFKKTPTCLLLLSPWTDMTLKGESVVYNGELDSIKPSFGLHKIRELYLGFPLKSNPNRIDLPHIEKDGHFLPLHYLTDDQLSLPIFSPVHHDLDKLPPILIQTGDLEILYSDNKQLATKLNQVRNDFEWSVFPSQVHMFQSFPTLHTTKASLDQCVQFISNKV